MCRSECLLDYLPDSMWKKVEARMRSNPAALAQLRHTRPWLASMLVETYDTLKAGFQSEYGTEAQLQNVYLRARGRIVGLETLNEQISTFTKLTSAQQREMLAQDLVQTPAENVADVKELHRLWRIGDADALKAWDDAKGQKLARSKALAARSIIAWSMSATGGSSRGCWRSRRRTSRCLWRSARCIWAGSAACWSCCGRTGLWWRRRESVQVLLSVSEGSGCSSEHEVAKSRSSITDK